MDKTATAASVKPVLLATADDLCLLRRISVSTLCLRVNFQIEKEMFELCCNDPILSDNQHLTITG